MWIRELGNGQHFPYLPSWAISFTPSPHWGLSAFMQVPFPVFSFHGHKEIKHRLNGGVECREYLGAVKIRTVDSFPIFSFFSCSLYPCCFPFLLCSYLSPTASVLRFLTLYFCNGFSSVFLILLPSYSFFWVLILTKSSKKRSLRN